MQEKICPECSCKMEVQEEYEEYFDEEIFRRGCECGYEDICTQEGDIIKVITSSEVYRRPFSNISFSDIFIDYPKMSQEAYHNLISLAHPQEP